MSVKILVLGSTGMLGHMVSKVLSREGSFTVFGTRISDPADPFYFDVEQGLEKLELIYAQNKGFDYMVNCIGFTADRVDSTCSASIIRAIKINALFPHHLAYLARKKNTRVIHMSTDGVFSGHADFYDEDAPSNCFDIYGKTKSLGEVINKTVLNIRCSIIGPSPFEKRGLFEWFRSRPEDSTISGYTNHIWNGLTTFQFAVLCKKIMKTNQFDTLREDSSVFHFAPNQPVSKYELLDILKIALHKNITIKPVEHGSGSVKRILVSKYDRFRKLYDCNIPMKKAIEELIEFAGF